MFQTAFYEIKITRAKGKVFIRNLSLFVFQRMYPWQFAHAFTLAYVGSRQDLAQVFCVVTLERCFIACFW